MAESQNPYESPESTAVEANGRSRDVHRFDARVMISLIIATAILGGLDYAVLEVGFFVVLGPPILFFVVTVWAVIAGTRAGSLSIGKRIAAGIVAGLFAVPCFELLLVFTCTPVAAYSGGQFDIHHAGIAGSFQERITFSLITAAFIAGVGFLPYLLLRMFRTPQKSPDSSNLG